MEVGGQMHALAVLPQGKSPEYLLGRRLDGLQSGSGRGDEEKRPWPRRESNPDNAALRIAVILTELSRRPTKISRLLYKLLMRT